MKNGGGWPKGEKEIGMDNSIKIEKKKQFANKQKIFFKQIPQKFSFSERAANQRSYRRIFPTNQLSGLFGSVAKLFAQQVGHFQPIVFSLFRRIPFGVFSERPACSI